MTLNSSTFKLTKRAGVFASIILVFNDFYDQKWPITFHETPQRASWANYYLTLYVSPCNLLGKTSAWAINSVSVFPTVTANGRKRNNMSTVAYLLFVIRIQIHAFWVGPTHKAILRTSMFSFVIFFRLFRQKYGIYLRIQGKIGAFWKNLVLLNVSVLYPLYPAWINAYWLYLTFVLDLVLYFDRNYNRFKNTYKN